MIGFCFDSQWPAPATGCDQQVGQCPRHSLEDHIVDAHRIGVVARVGEELGERGERLDLLDVLHRWTWSSVDHHYLMCFEVEGDSIWSNWRIDGALCGRIGTIRNSRRITEQLDGPLDAHRWVSAVRKRTWFGSARWARWSTWSVVDGLLGHLSTIWRSAWSLVDDLTICWSLVDSLVITCRRSGGLSVACRRWSVACCLEVLQSRSLAALQSCCSRRSLVGRWEASVELKLFEL